MKKVLFVLVFMIAALVANAQATSTTKSATTAKATTATAKNQKAVRTDVKVAELQKSITDNVAKDYVGFKITKATSVALNNTVTYDVVVTKGKTTETLVYDKDGNFVKKMAAKTGKKPGSKKRK